MKINRMHEIKQTSTVRLRGEPASWPGLTRGNEFEDPKSALIADTYCCTAKVSTPRWVSQWPFSKFSCKEPNAIKAW